MSTAYLNAIATAVPDFDVHAKFVDYGPRLLPDERFTTLFRRMAMRAQIEHRYSFLQPHTDTDKMDVDGFYEIHKFPDTKQRMDFYERNAFKLAKRALDQLDISSTTHLIVTSCTGFYAPGIDHQIIRHYGLPAAVERTMVGFMGCYAAMNALKLARHIIRSESSARVLVVNLELCTLHLKPGNTLEDILPFLIFSDGCAASVISSRAEGIELQTFTTNLLPDTEDLITWKIGELGFDMNLSRQVPESIATHLPAYLNNILNGCTRNDITHWAIHPGGRSVLDAVRDSAKLEEHSLAHSRDILRRFGNMSSATIMFVLKNIMDEALPGQGCAIAFGPGLSVESMRFAM
jgi:predicted naringenin-chalcone synthase